MLFDKENLFSNNQAVTVSAASANIVKMGAPDAGLGTPKPFVAQVTKTFTGCTSVTLSIETADNEAFTSPVTLSTSGAIPVAKLTAGYRFPINFIPRGNLGYMRLYYTVAGTATAGTITAGIVAGDEGSYQNI